MRESKSVSKIAVNSHVANQTHAMQRSPPIQHEWLDFTDQTQDLLNVDAAMQKPHDCCSYASRIKVAAERQRCERSTVLPTTAVFYSTVGSVTMQQTWHSYKPGTAMGSTRTPGLARNQRETLRAPSAAILPPSGACSELPAGETSPFPSCLN